MESNEAEKQDKAIQQDDNDRNTILLVDDDADFRVLTTRILHAQGYEVVEAESIKIALQKISKKTPNLIILDLQLAGETGADFLKAKKSVKELLGVPIIVCSGHAHKDNILQIKQLGANDFLGKPIKQTALIQKIRKFLSKSTNLNFRFKNDDLQTVQISFTAKLDKLSSSVCTIRSPHKFKKFTRVNLNADYLTKSGIQSNSFETTGDSYFVQGGVFETNFMILGANNEDEKKLQELVNRI
jgi:CheY-like chemotaxis protein